MLLDHPDRPRRDLRSLENVLLGGAPSSPELIRRVQDELSARVSVRYSSTEVGIATASLPDDPPERARHHGRQADAGRRAAHRRPPTARRCPPARSGGVEVRSPATMRGYWHDPDATAAVVDAEGWIHTGDLGFLDDAGYLHLRGRRSEMFIRGGYNVYPGEVEDLLATPSQGGARRRGRRAGRDARRGRAGRSWSPRDPRDPPTLAELRAFVGAELASFKRPDGLTLLPEMPVTPMFKVDKQALRDLRG